jgi:dethiobiotin synthetase
MALTLLITGTDTEVGKTFVGVGLITALSAMGFRVAPFKPVETGCLQDPMNRTLIPADARLLESASGTAAPLDTICPYRYSLPVAPFVAAESEHRAIELPVLDQCLERLKKTHDVVLIETAGGLLVPVTQETNFADLARRWSTPVLVVAGSRLGVLNQTLLTIRHLENAGLPIAGCVLNHPFGDYRATAPGEKQVPALESNLVALRRLVSCRVWDVPFSGSALAGTLEVVFAGIADDLVSKWHSENA